MNSGPTNAEKIRRLPYVIVFDAFNSTFCQLSVLGSVFIFYLAELGLPKRDIGAILSLVPFSSMGAIFLAPLAARIGVRRVFLTFWGTRNLFAAGVLLSPWVCGLYGLHAAFLYIAGLMACFSLCRAFGEAANTQWRQDIIPANIRGRFIAFDNVVFALVAFGCSYVASTVLASSTSISRYVWLMAAGTVVGASSILWAAQFPGGRETQRSKGARFHVRRFSKVLRDRNFLLYLSALSLVTFGSAPLAVFVPLFLKEQVGIPPSTVVLLQNGALVGTLLSSYFWGWAADRYGSKPVILSGLGLLILPPLGWVLIPYHSAWSALIVLVVFLMTGIAAIGYGVGTGRQLYVTIVPPRRKTHYMSIYCAWMGAVGGLGQILAGQSMDLAKGLSGSFLIFSINPYTALFAFSILMLLLGLTLQYRVEADGSIPVRRFVGMFLQGNPLMAVESLFRYSWAGREADRVVMIRRLGRAMSPLSTDELADALEDPSLGVRYEAIAAIAHTRPAPRLTADLMDILVSGQPDLSIEAAWALARVGDPAAIPSLRWTFASADPLMQLRSARALACFGDLATPHAHPAPNQTEAYQGTRRYPSGEKSIAPELQRRIASEPDGAFRRALTATLNSLGGKVATGIRRKRLGVSFGAAGLIAALQDPDFEVRYEAILQASHRRPIPRLTAAVADILEGGEPDLSIEAAWALGRMGDVAAVEPLMRTLNAGYPLLQARSARALAALGERGIIPLLRQRLAGNDALGIRLSYASALGQLQATPAAGEIIRLHEQMPNQSWARELNLAMARLIGQEAFYIRLWRAMRKEPGTSASNALHKILKKVVRRGSPRANRMPHDAHARLAQCAQAIGHEDLSVGAAMLADILAGFTPEATPPSDHGTPAVPGCQLPDMAGRCSEQSLTFLEHAQGPGTKKSGADYGQGAAAVLLEHSQGPGATKPGAGYEQGAAAVLKIARYCCQCLRATGSGQIEAVPLAIACLLALHPTSKA